MMVLIATTSGGSLAMKVELPPTPEEVRRLEGLCAQPGMRDAVWTAKPGSEVR